MATAVVDVDYLSTYLSVPQQTLSSVLDTPTADLVRSVLDAVTAKAREHDELAADKLRVDIELENAVRSSETRIEGLRGSVEKTQKTVEEVRTKLKEEEDSRSALESELQALKSSSSTSTSEVETLRARIASLESANRDTIAVLESKSTANDSLSNDLQKQHQKGLELSQQIASLQQSVQNADSAASSAKFREQSLKQEVELARKNNEWFENELKTKSAEALKYRKEKGARIAELQRLNEEANSNVDALKRTEQGLRARVEDLQKKAEDSLIKVQQLQESAAKSEEGFRQELESSHRLAELQSQQTETHRNRLREVEAALEKARDEMAEEVGRCRQEAESERQEREQSERRIVELEAEVDRLEALVSAPPHSSVPGTPRQGLNGSMLGRSGSPAAFGTPGSRSKSNITATQALEEVYKLKGLLATEKRATERLRQDMDEVLNGLEAKQPEIDEMQAEHDRAQQEVIEMSRLLDQASKERDRAKKDARKAESEASTAQAEGNILRQQLRDLSAQVKMLLCDIDARDRGLEALSATERSQLERLARGEVGEDAFEGLTDTDRFISQRLVVFKDITELQNQNQELLKITRQLGAQMESEEALAAKNQAAKDHEEVHSLHAAIENYKDELQSMITRSESYVKERDMFRRMLQHRGQLPPSSEFPSAFGQSIDGNQSVVHNAEQNPAGNDNANYATLLRELQAHFDQYREEQTIDRRTMKEQTERLSLEKGTLQSEVAKVSSQFEITTQRLELLQSNYMMLQNENSELQKRSHILSESSAKQDLRTQQVAEDLIEAKGIVESMRNENANLKAEKSLWKDIQDRLNQDNEGLMNERARLNNLIANQQTLQNERELSDSETRRRLQSQVESLESEMTTTKRKLSDEIEDNKKAQLRKEYDLQQNQKRIDDLVSSLSQVREELVAAKTTRDHFQTRVDELAIELKSAEERVDLLQPRPTPRTTTAEANTTLGSSEQGSLNKEQELAIEVSELKRDLDLAKSELEGAKNQMEQYRSISQSSEEELQSLNATQDQYREEMDRIIEEKDSKNRELQQRIDDITAELTNTNNELTTIRNQQGEVARKAEEDRAVLETEISRLKDEDERHATASQFHQQDLRAQAEIATKAQQDYENELVKHAEAAKLLQILRTEHNQLKSEVATIKAEAESARVALSQSESSWEERRDQFEQEVKELRTRRDDVNAQNKLLHQQLEHVGAQISTLQQSRSLLSGNPEAGNLTPEASGDRNADGLRELNSYLRREKEIVEVQYDLKVQEAKRLQQQLQYAQSQLDESRLKLDQERRLQADGGRSSLFQKDIMEKINELNILRESGVTLRNETRQAQNQLAEKTKRVEMLEEQIQPLQMRVRELEHGKESADGEMLLLKEDRDRWQKRTQDIISKYDRIDPAEMDQLKETMEALKTERDALLEGRQPLQEQVNSLEVEKSTWQQSRQKLIEQAKERSRLQGNQIKDRSTERDAAIQEKENLQQQLSTLQQELETAIKEKESAEQHIVSLCQELEVIRAEREQALPNPSENTVEESSTEATTVQANDDTTNEHLATLRSELEQSVSEKVSLDSQVKQLKDQLQVAISERDAAVADAADARSKQDHPVPESSPTNDTEEGQVTENTPIKNYDEERKRLEERIAEAEARAKEQEDKANKIEAEMEATLKSRSDKMKAALNKKLVDARESQKTELKVELENDYRLKLEQERKIITAEVEALNRSSSASAVPPQLKPNQDPGPATPATPATPGHKPAGATVDGTNLTDAQVRELLSSNPTVKAILASNLKKKVEAEVQKLKEEQEKTTTEKLAEAQQKAEIAKTQAVAMETKKSALRINISDNKARISTAKLGIVETAAKETPEKPVREVWEVASAYKPAPPAPSEPANTANGTKAALSKPVEIKSENSKKEKTEATTQASQVPNAQLAVNGPSSVLPSGLPLAPQIATAAPPASRIPSTSGIPRGGGPTRGGRGGPQGTQPPMRGGGQQPGRGRGGQQRGGLNAGAQNFSPGGPAGLKRPREDGSIGGQGGKRGRGG